MAFPKIKRGFPSPLPWPILFSLTCCSVPFPPASSRRVPTKTEKLPAGGQWLHEIKHDGFRIIARKDGDRVRLYSRPGNDMTRRFPLIAEALARLRSRSCIIDGETVAAMTTGSLKMKNPDATCDTAGARHPNDVDHRQGGGRLDFGTSIVVV
jgi:hypothetical protein